jgi:hypothetical protein
MIDAFGDKYLQASNEENTKMLMAMNEAKWW